MTGRRPGAHRADRLGIAGRLKRSLAFRRSREASAAIVDDAAELRDLADSVRDARASDGDLDPVAEQIDAALEVLDGRAEQLEGGPAGASALPPARAARHRLVVAAMHYLTRSRRPRPGESESGDLDEVLVVREVIDCAGVDLVSDADDEPAGSSAAGERPGVSAAEELHGVSDADEDSPADRSRPV